MVITRKFINNLSNSFFKSCSMDHKLQFYYSFFVSFLCGHFGHGVGHMIQMSSISLWFIVPKIVPSHLTFLQFFSTKMRFTPYGVKIKNDR